MNRVSEGLGSKCPRRTKQPKSLELLANAGEPPNDTPAVEVAIDAHAALDTVPAVEGGVAPVAFVILPVGGVGVLVSKGRVVLVGFGSGERIGRLEGSAFESLLEILIAHVAGLGILPSFGLEEDYVDFFALTLRHSIHDRLGRVLLPAGRVEDSLRGEVTVRTDTADDEIRIYLDTPPEDGELFFGQLALTKNLLHDFGWELPGMLFEHCAVIRDSLVDLTRRHHLEWGHGFHGVILPIWGVLCLRSTDMVVIAKNLHFIKSFWL